MPWGRTSAKPDQDHEAKKDKRPPQVCPNGRQSRNAGRGHEETLLCREGKKDQLQSIEGKERPNQGRRESANSVHACDLLNSLECQTERPLFDASIRFAFGIWYTY